MEELNFFKFTYRHGQPVRNYGKIVLLDKKRMWGLVEGWEYIIENPEVLELEKCIIIKSATFVLVDDIPTTYEVSGGPYIDTEICQIKFSIRYKLVYKGKVISSDTDYKNFTFGLTGREEFYDLLPADAQQQVDDFRVWITWIRENQLIVLSGNADFMVRRGFRLQSNTESLKVETSGRGSQEYPKEVDVIKLQTLVYQPVFQEGCEPSVAEGPKEIINRLKSLSLDESGLPFSFRSVWKSPTIMVGILTINGEAVEGLVKRPGDGTGSYLDAVMYLGLMEMPPATLSANDIAWLDSGGRICWVYEFSSNINYGLNTTTTPPDNPEGWFKLVSVCGGVLYIQDSFNHPEYVTLLESLRPKPLLKEVPVEVIEKNELPVQQENVQALIAEEESFVELEIENEEKSVDTYSSDSNESDLAIKLRRALGQ
jgi:hypothetical protein